MKVAPLLYVGGPADGTEVELCDYKTCQVRPDYELIDLANLGNGDGSTTVRSNLVAFYRPALLHRRRVVRARWRALLEHFGAEKWQAMCTLQDAMTAAPRVSGRSFE